MTRNEYYASLEANKQELFLQHHGILGQKWGIRRFQNKDGTLTTAGKKRLAENSKNKSDGSTDSDVDGYHFTESKYLGPGIVETSTKINIGKSKNVPLDISCERGKEKEAVNATKNFLKKFSLENTIEQAAKIHYDTDPLFDKIGMSREDYKKALEPSIFISAELNKFDCMFYGEDATYWHWITASGSIENPSKFEWSFDG